MQNRRSIALLLVLMMFFTIVPLPTIADDFLINEGNGIVLDANENEDGVVRDGVQADPDEPAFELTGDTSEQTTEPASEIIQENTTEPEVLLGNEKSTEPMVDDVEEPVQTSSSEADPPELMTVLLTNVDRAIYTDVETQWCAQVRGGTPYSYTLLLYKANQEDMLDQGVPPDASNLTLYQEFPAQTSDLFRWTFSEAGCFFAFVTVTDVYGEESSTFSEMLTVSLENTYDMQEELPVETSEEQLGAPMGNPPEDTLVVIVIDDPEPLSITLAGPSQTLETKVSAEWVAYVEGGLAPYQYQFSLYLDGALSEEFPAQETNVLQWAFAVPGLYTVSVTVTDAVNTQVTEEAFVNVSEPIAPEVLPDVPEASSDVPEASSDEASDVLDEVINNLTPLTVTLSSAAQMLAPDESAEWVAQVEGGQAPYAYLFSLYAEDSLYQDSASNTAVLEWAFKEPGNYTVSVVVTDATGTQATSTTSVVVSAPVDLTGISPTGTEQVPMRAASMVPYYYVGTRYGDLNNDGRVDQQDLELLKQYMLGFITLSNWRVADLNGDGVVDIIDVAQLNLFIGGYITTFSVEALVTITLNAVSAVVDKGNTFQLTATVLPTSTINRSVTWSSSNPLVATVSSTGLVTARAAGATQITAQAVVGGKTATCVVTVLPSTPSINVTASSSGINISWGAITNVTGYEVWRATSLNGSYVKLATSYGTSYYDATVIVNQTYYYKVRSYFSQNSQTSYSAYSPVQSAMVVSQLVKPTLIELSPSGTQNLSMGKTLALTPKVTPSNATATLTWTSSNTAVATVSQTGVVTPKAVGTAVITVRTDNGQTASVTVNVKVDPTSVALSPSGTISITKDLTLMPIVSPSNATTTYTWTSSNTAVAAVSQAGLVTPKAAGSAVITVKTANGKTASVTVKVVNVVQPTSIALSPDGTVKLDITKTLTLMPIVTPTNAYTSITWSSSNTAVATVSNGVVTPRQVGTAVITAKTSNGKTARMTVSVVSSIQPTAVALSPAGTISLDVGKSLTLTPMLTPVNAGTTYQWSSSNTKVATVTNGVVKAVAVGSATITVSTANGKTASVKINVVKSGAPVPTSVKLNYSGIVSLSIQKTLTLKPTVTPSNAATTFTWTSSNTKVATVTNGVVMPVGAGSAVITVKTANGKTAKVTVQVTGTPVLPTSVKLNPSGTISITKPMTLTPILNPINAKTTYTWTSSDKKVATVSTSGLVTPVAAGSAVITVRTSNGKTASVTVKVGTVIQPTSVTLSPSGTANLDIRNTLTLTPILLPSNALATTTWTSSNTKVATVSASGLVKPLAIGSTVITVKTNNGLTAKTTVNVVSSIEPTAVSLTPSSTQSLDVGKTLTLKPSLTPSDAWTTYTWTTSNASVATVDSNGVVKAVAAGTATITVRTANNKTTSVTVNVVNTATSLKLTSVAANKTTYTLNETATITATTTGGTAPVQYRFVVYKEGQSSVYMQQTSYSSTRTYSFKPTAAGRYYVVCYAMDANGVTVSGTTSWFTVNQATTLTVSVAANKSTYTLAETATITATSTGGTAPVQYRFAVYKEGQTSVYTQQTSYSSTKTYSFKPNATGWYYVTCYAMDANGVTVTGNTSWFSVNQAATPLALTSVTANKTTYTLDETATITATSTGGTTPVQYRFVVYKEGQTSIYSQTLYSSTKTYSFKLTETGRYYVACYAMDANSVTVSDATFWFSVNQTTPDVNKAFIDEVVRLVNVERVKAGLSTVSGGYAALNSAAAVRAGELLQRFEHTRPNGSSCFTALSEKGVSYWTCGENIAAGYATPAEVVAGWMNSSGHRANILNSSFNYLGVGYVYSGATTYKHYWVQLFTGTK